MTVYERVWSMDSIRDYQKLYHVHMATEQYVSTLGACAETIIPESK